MSQSEKNWSQLKSWVNLSKNRVRVILSEMKAENGFPDMIKNVRSQMKKLGYFEDCDLIKKVGSQIKGSGYS